MDYSKIIEIQKETKVSNREIAKYLKMSGVGYGKMLDNHTCTVATLEAIATYFKKDITYFFIKDKVVYPENHPDLDIINDKPISPKYKKCTDPECIEDREILESKIKLQNKVIDLLEEKIEKLEEQEGDLLPGEKRGGGMEKPRKTG